MKLEKSLILLATASGLFAIARVFTTPRADFYTATNYAYIHTRTTSLSGAMRHHYGELNMKQRNFVCFLHN